jgi:hypothetical protein
MVTAAEIRDRETLEAWLTGRSREDALCIAHRAAMRVAPLFWGALGEDWARKGDLTALVTLWPLLTSGVAHKLPTPEVMVVGESFAPRASGDGVVALEATEANAAQLAAEVASLVLNAVNPAEIAANAANTASFACVLAADSDAVLDERAFLEWFWENVQRDSTLIAAGGDPFDLPLWGGRPHEVGAHNPGKIKKDWSRTRVKWTEAGGLAWDFWTQFYENAIEGHPQDWPLLHDIALIPAEDWQGGPDRVHPIIEGILKRRADQEIGKGEVAQDLANLPAASWSTIQQVQAALSLNRVSLPPTLDAIEGFIALEIARLQSRNHQSDGEAEEARRMIRTLSFLAEAVLQLRVAVPAEGPAREGQAKDVEGLARLYMKKLGELPRIKVDEVVEGIWSAGRGACQIGLIGCSATLMVALGLPALASVAAATLVIAPKLGSDAIKGAVELARSQAKP